MSIDLCPFVSVDLYNSLSNQGRIEKAGLLSDEEDDEEDEEDVHRSLRQWGKNKQQYYNADATDLEIGQVRQGKQGELQDWPSSPFSHTPFPILDALLSRTSLMLRKKKRLPVKSNRPDMMIWMKVITA